MSNIIKLTPKKLRQTNVNDYKSGDCIYIGEKYIIHLKKVKYNTFTLESSVENSITWKYIDPAFWPQYINNFLYGNDKSL
ncbi:hypothetical protein LCGC14_2922330 [marine sediment metagenome]|uniref:Uncharacterized protein n=1 Tax=marine sediment metagenome TaxID=412755 RepID=A0A0F8XNQ8_9ZZZZ